MPPTRTRAGDVGRGPPGQDRDRERSGRVGGDAGQATQRPPGERHDRRGAGVARALGQRPVEVGTRRAAAPAAPPAGRSRDGRAIPSSARRSRPRPSAVAGQGVTSTPGRIVSARGHDVGADAAQRRRRGRAPRGRGCWRTGGAGRRDGRARCWPTGWRGARRSGDRGRRAARCDRDRRARRRRRRRIGGEREESPRAASPATATPTTRPATIDRRAFMSRGGYQYERAAALSRGPLLPCRSHGAVSRPYPHADRSGAPDRARRHASSPAGVLSLTTTRSPPIRCTTPAAVGRRPRAVVSATPSPLHHAAAARLRRAARRPSPGDPGRPGRHPRAHRRAQDRPAGHLRVRRLPGLQRRDVAHRRPARPARRGQGDLPLRACPDRDVPADADRVEGLERQEDDRDGRGGLDQRRPALPVRHHQGRRHVPYDKAFDPAVRGRQPSSSGSRRRRARDAAEAPARRRAAVPGAGRPRRGQPGGRSR